MLLLLLLFGPRLRYRNTAGHKARNQYLESLLSLQLRAKKHFCFRELKLLTQTVDQLQLERRREVNVKKNPNPDIILDAGWKSARPPERGVEVRCVAPSRSAIVRFGRLPVRVPLTW